MLRALRPVPSAGDDHESAFLERYRRLYGRALRLTGDREDAEDLIQDAFVQFVLSRKPLEEIRNLDAYLFTMLQYLHASDLRRAARRPASSLEAIDHDSAEIALRASDASRWYLACEELGLICDYACERSLSSRTGSALLLRYFHGYYVREIAQILQSPPTNVDGLMHVARREAKIWVSERPRAAMQRFPATRRACLDGLRAGIFAHAHRTCFRPAWFEEVYVKLDRPKPLSASDLAEIVTCPRCLDSANEALGLPRLADRYPTDTLGPERRSGPGRGPASSRGARGGGDSEPGDPGSPPDRSEPADTPLPGDAGAIGSDVEPVSPEKPAEARLLQLVRAAEAVREHRPRELCVTVNGLPVASQRTASVQNEQRVTVPGGEAISFIEVFSEQQVRMLLMEVEAAPEGAIEQRRLVELSGGRTLEASVRFAERWPEIRVNYRDPEASTFDAEADLPVELTRENDGLASTVELPCSSDEASVSPNGGHEPRWSSAWSRIRRLAGGIPGGARLPRASAAWFLRPQAVSAALALVLLALWALQTFLAAPVLSARELLDRAVAEEAADVPVAGELRRRVVEVEERRHEDGIVLEKTRVEIWTGRSRQLSARRAYDGATGVVLGLELSNEEGGTTVYRRSSNPERVVDPASTLLAVLDAGEPWRLALSPARFQSLAAALPGATVRRTGNQFVLRGRSDAGVGEGRLVEASLAFADDTLSLVSAVLVVRRPSGVREYRFTKQSDERVPAASVGVTPFRPDEGLVTGESDARPTSPESTSVPGPALSAQQLAGLKLQAFYLLDQAGATLGEQVTVSSEGGSVAVEALVEGEARKQELLRALAPLAASPDVRVNVRTIVEAARRPDVPRVPSLVRGVEPIGEKVAAYDAVRRYVMEHADPSWPAEGPERDASIEREALRIGVAVIGHARLALQHAWALHRLVATVPPETAASLDGNARDRWWTVVGEHALACRNETSGLRLALSPVFRPGQPTTAIPEAQSHVFGDVRAAIKQLLAAARLQEEAVRSAFTLPTVSAVPAVALEETEFWDAVLGIESLAGQLEAARHDQG